MGYPEPSLVKQKKQLCRYLYVPNSCSSQQLTMRHASSATPLEPTTCWDSMTLWNSWSLECAPKAQGPLRNNLPLLSRQDLKEGILGCQQDLQLKLLLRAQVNDAECSGPSHNWSYITLAPKPFFPCFFISLFWFPLFFPHLSQSALRSQWQLKAGDFYNIKLPRAPHVYRDHSNKPPEHLLYYQEHTLIQVRWPQLLEALDFTVT